MKTLIVLNEPDKQECKNSCEAMPKRQGGRAWKIKSIFAVTLLCFFIAACGDDNVTGTDEGEIELTSRTVELGAMPFWTDSPSFGPTHEQINGTASVTVMTNMTFTFQIEASGFEPGHSVTLWVFDGSGAAGGFADSGLVGENGKIFFTGTNCVHPVAFVPGQPPSCDMIDLTAPNTAADFFVTLEGVDEDFAAVLSEGWVQGLNFFLLDHGEWEPGKMESLWTDEGLFFVNTTALFDFSDL